MAAYGWRLIVLAVVTWGLLWLLNQLRLVLFPLVAALLLAVALTPPTRWLRRRGWSPGLAAATVLLALLGAVALAGVLIVPAVVDEFADLGPTLEEAVDDVERWLVQDSPFDIDRVELDDLKDQASDALRAGLRGSDGLAVRSAVLLIEVVTGIVLSLVSLFFFLKDGERIQAWVLKQLPPDRRPLASRLASRGWETLGGYLRGSATLGVIEASIIGASIAGLAGAFLAVPVTAVAINVVAEARSTDQPSPVATGSGGG